MDDIEAYVKAGGNLLISGPIANPEAAEDAWRKSN